MKNFPYKVIVFFSFFVFLSCKTEEKKQQIDKTNTLPYFNEATFTPIWLVPNSKEVENLHKIPSFTLTNQNGKTITEKTFEDKIYVVDFFFTTCPGICPKMTKNMHVVQEEFKNDNEFLLLSHSVTPKRDSISILKDYAIENNIISGKWHLVTGVKKEIYNLGRKSYFAEEDLSQIKTEDDFLHTENFILIDKKKHIRGVYNGLNKNSIKQLIADIKILKKEI